MTLRDYCKQYNMCCETCEHSWRNGEGYIPYPPLCCGSSGANIVKPDYVCIDWESKCLNWEPNNKQIKE